MGSRPRSPSPASCWGPQPAGPGPAKRRRLDAPAGPEPEATPVPEGPAGPRAAAALPSVVVLAAGCALQVALGDAELVLVPAPTSVLQVSLGDHTLVLVPEALLGPGMTGREDRVPRPAASSPALSWTLRSKKSSSSRGSFCASAPDADEEDVEIEYLEPWADPPGSVAAPRGSPGRAPSPCSQGPMPEPAPRVPTPSPESRSPDPYFNLDSHLLESFPDSPLQPLLPSPSPEPRERPQRSPPSVQGPETPVPGVNCLPRSLTTWV